MKKLIFVFIVFTTALLAQTKTKKIDPYTFQVEKSELTTKVIQYDLDFLLGQKERIIADAKAYALAREKEIAELDSLIIIAKNLGIISKPKEENK